MTDLPLSQSQPVNGAGKIGAGFARLIALFRDVCGALAQATTWNAQRRAIRRAPEEILMARARREQARRAVDRLMLLR